jgi:hypothetical protein
MYTLTCPTLGEVSLSPDAIVSLHRTMRGTTGYIRCACGATAVLTVGRLELDAALHHPQPASDTRDLVTVGTPSAA